LHWITQSEDDNIGWNIYRNDENELNNAVKVNTDLIDGQGTTAEPSYYNYSDNSEELTIGTTYYYWLESLDLSGQTHVYDNSLVTITIPDPTNQPPNYEKPVVYSLNAAPNPMLDQTDFHFTLDRDAMVNISIYNLKGKLIKKLPAIAANSDEKMTVYWNGKDSNNKRLYSGIYLYKLGVNGKTIKTNKLLIIR
ncbi:MAG: T9SS type A sorting domain-containing protein, partial [Candidatus Cloacimonetes bacterium]|nr:T9SS type A sorting domain-containing protein [Candidatus Cloacimonadota bacterium]